MTGNQIRWSGALLSGVCTTGIGYILGEELLIAGLLGLLAALVAYVLFRPIVGSLFEEID